MMYRIKWVTITLALVLMSLTTKAQDQLIDNYSLSLTFGARSVARTPQPSPQLDFLNYLSVDDPYFVAYQYFNFAGHFDFRGKWQADVILNYNDSDLSLLLQAQRTLTGNFGINMGAYWLAYDFNSYEEFYKSKDPGFPYFVNSRYGTVRDFGFMLGPAYSARGKFGFVDAKLNVGLNSFTPFTESFLLYSEGSNLRQRETYETEFSFSPFVAPELTTGIYLYRGKRSYFGIQGRFLWFASQVNVPYQKTTSTWTVGNSATERFTPDDAPLRRTEYEAGLFLYYH